MFIVSASGGQKPQFWQMLTLGGSCTDSLLPMRAKFGALEQTQGLHLHAKFHLNVFIVLDSGGQKPQFWANFDIWEASIPIPFTKKGQIWCVIVNPWYTFTCQKSSRLVHIVAIWRRKPQFLPFLDFGI